MYILCLFEAVYISHDLTLEKKGLECVTYSRKVKIRKQKVEQ